MKIYVLIISTVTIKLLTIATSTTEWTGYDSHLLILGSIILVTGASSLFTVDGCWPLSRTKRDNRDRKSGQQENWNVAGLTYQE